MPLIRRSVFAAAAFLAAGGVSLAQSPGKPNDAQIAHIAYTADNIDIKAGRLAVQKSKNTRVRAFAEDMVRDHTAVNDKALSLVKKLNVTPEDNAASRTLTQQADPEDQKLSALNGAAFDNAYAEHELAYHRQVIDDLRTTLIPSTTNPELKQLLMTGLKIFEGHLQHAEQLVQTLK